MLQVVIASSVVMSSAAMVIQATGCCMCQSGKLVPKKKFIAIAWSLMRSKSKPSDGKSCVADYFQGSFRVEKWFRRIKFTVDEGGHQEDIRRIPPYQHILLNQEQIYRFLEELSGCMRKPDTYDHELYCMYQLASECYRYWSRGLSKLYMTDRWDLVLPSYPSTYVSITNLEYIIFLRAPRNRSFSS